MKPFKQALLYFIFFVFAAASLYQLITVETMTERDFVFNFTALVFFGGGGISYFFLTRKNQVHKEIPINSNIIFESKKKAVFYVLGSLAFVIAGFFMMYYNHYFSGRKMNPQIAFIIGLICLLFLD